MNGLLPQAKINPNGAGSVSMEEFIRTRDSGTCSCCCYRRTFDFSCVVGFNARASCFVVDIQPTCLDVMDAHILLQRMRSCVIAIPTTTLVALAFLPSRDAHAVAGLLLSSSCNMIHATATNNYAQSSPASPSLTARLAL